MRQGDLDFLEYLRVDPDLLRNLGPVATPGDLHALSRAEALLSEANGKIRHLLSHAREHVERERQAEQQQQAMAFLDLLQQQSGQMDTLQRTLQSQFEERLTPLVAGILRRMSLNLSPSESIRAAVQLFVAQFSHVDAPVLQVCPADRDALEQSGGLQLPSGWKLDSDAALVPGACCLRTGYGSVSCSVTQMLDRLAQWLQTAPDVAPAQTEEALQDNAEPEDDNGPLD